MQQILLTHPTGNTFSRALLEGLLGAGALGLFGTTIAVSERSAWLNVLPGRMRGELLRRKFEVPPEKLFTRPALETVRLLAGRLGISWLNHHETGFASYDAVYGNLDLALARDLRLLKTRHKLTGVYAYEMGASHLFPEARKLGLGCFYDLPIAYWETSQRLLNEEVKRWPAWAPTLLGVRDSPAKCQRKRNEIEMADVVICPSQFVLDSIPDEIRRGRKCIVAEFGSPPRTHWNETTARRSKLRVLFAGSMTQRKGLADVFAAMKLLNRSDVELVVMGSTVAPLEFYRKEFASFTYEPPRPHHEVLKLMESCDVFVLPSIVEGRALVQQEAMSMGLPLIVTKNAGGEDLIEEGKTGFLVPIRAPEAIAERIEWLASNPGSLPEMKRNASAKAASVTWAAYVKKILEAMDDPVGAENSRNNVDRSEAVSS